MGISAVVPVYNSARSLPTLVQRLRPVLDTAADELIVVNDGSRDRSWDAISLLAAGYRWILGIDLMRNYGQHSARSCEIRSAAHDVIITLDDDLQHHPR